MYAAPVYTAEEIPMFTDQETIRGIGGHLLWAILKEMHYPHHQSTVNTTKETLMNQNISSRSEEGKVEESIAANGLSDKCKN